MTYAFLMTALAGSATIIGALFIFIGGIDKRLIARSLSLSAGLMIYLSLVNLIPISSERLMAVSDYGKSISIFGFFFGAISLFLIEKMVDGHRHSDRGSFDVTKLSIMSMISLTVHNAPEGLSIFSLAMNSDNLTAPVIGAIALHNIPEGIILAGPIFLKTKSFSKTMAITAIAASVEPIAGLFGYMMLTSVAAEMASGISLSVAAGMMLYLSLEQLLPEARKMNDNYPLSYWVFAGMIVAVLMTY